MSDFEQSYAGRLRAHVGNGTLIVPSARAVLLDDAGGVLLIKRRDNGRWALPAGLIELGESIDQCLVREVREETGLTVESFTPVALYTQPRFTASNAHGQSYQMFALLYRVDAWSGDLLTHTDETADARFFPLADRPEIPDHHRESIQDVLAFDGTFIVK